MRRRRRRAGTARSTSRSAGRVVRRVLLPRSASSSYRTTGTALQDQVRQFGFGSDTGVDLPFEFDGRCPTGAQERARRPRRAQRGRGGRLRPATTCSWRSGRACWRRRRCSSPRLRGDRQRRLRAPARSREGDLGTRAPDKRAGLRRLLEGHDRRGLQRRPSARQIPMPDEIRDPIVRRAAPRTSPGPGVDRPLPQDHRGALLRLPERRDPDRRQDRHRPGRHNYPWNDSSVFAAFSIDERPVQVVAVPREVRLRLAGRGAGREVHVPRAVGPASPLDRSSSSDPLDPNATSPRPPQPLADTTCWNGKEGNAVQAAERTTD